MATASAGWVLPRGAAQPRDTDHGEPGLAFKTRDPIPVHTGMHDEAGAHQTERATEE